MAEWVVTVQYSYRREMRVNADDEGEAEEKALDIITSWNGVVDAEAIEVLESRRAGHD